MALLLAVIGNYGVLSFAVAQRRREIGVCIALSALPGQIGRQFLSELHENVPVSPARQTRRRARRWLLGSGTVVVLALVTLGLSRLQPATPLVEKSSIWMDTVKRGEMLRQVRGNGTLLPEDIRWIPTINEGRLERILVLPGTAVQADTVLVQLSNPSLEQDIFEAESQFKAAKADMTNLRVQLGSPGMSCALIRRSRTAR